MFFTEKVEKVLDILNIDRKSVDLYTNMEIERFIEEIEYESYEDGFQDARSKYSTEYEADEVNLW